MKRTAALLLLAAAACNGSTDSTPPPELPASIRVVEVARGFSQPVYVASPAGDTRLFVVEQTGRIRIIQNGAVLATPFLDVTAKTAAGGERGLLSVAFHPQYATNGFFYIYYTDRAGDTRVERYRAAPATSNTADPASAQEVLFVDQPFANHNGGLLMFGPDGRLYVGLGDGGGSGDPQGNGQNPNTLLGKILRLDVDGAQPYSIPASNPFVGQAGKRGEIWITGLRNPWRYAFDRDAGLLYVADVGQNQWEEINVLPAATGGQNLGWNPMEGMHCFVAGCSQQGLTLPVLEYSHADGCSVTGGFVYRGSAIPGLRGHYFYSDFCGGWLRSFRWTGSAVADAREWEVGDLGNVTSFGEDSARELYITTAAGMVLKIVPPA